MRQTEQSPDRCRDWVRAVSIVHAPKTANRKGETLPQTEFTTVDNIQAIAWVTGTANPSAVNSPASPQPGPWFHRLLHSCGRSSRRRIGSSHGRKIARTLSSPLAMRMPEVAYFGIQVNEFDAVRETMMRNLDVFVVQPVTFQVPRLDAMQERLLDARLLCVAKQMRGQARA
jgi:hypothetical protein